MNEQPTRDIVRNLLATAGYKPYDYEGQYYRSLSHAAEYVTEGRTPYYQRGTRKAFHCRVLKLLTLCHGAVLGTIERVPHPVEGHLHRAVFFDFTGRVIHRTAEKLDGITSGFLKYQPARREFELVAETLDWAQVVQAALAHEVEKQHRKLRDINEAQVTLASILADKAK